MVIWLRILLLEDHPRGCGEHCPRRAGIPSWGGSSPRMRGAPDLIPGASNPVRIIPADAGSTKSASYVFSGQKDHPRGCGEHGGSDSCGHAGGGSSPRMRGAPSAVSLRFWGPGIIPADAGSTPASSWLPQASPDHPRGCGEHYARRDQHGDMEGSSPRMRGALVEYLVRMVE